MTQRDDSPGDTQEPRDRARRRLLKLALYVPPTILALSTFIGRAYAGPPNWTVTTQIELKGSVKSYVHVKISGTMGR